MMHHIFHNSTVHSLLLVCSKPLLTAYYYSHTLVGTNIKAKEGPVQMAQFVLNHRIDAVKRKVTIDGNNKEWANTDHALFVGSKSQAQGTLRCSI